MPPKLHPRERFWPNVDVRGPDECWPWMKSRNKKGYGRLNVFGRCKEAHRYAFELHHGRPPVNAHTVMSALSCGLDSDPLGRRRSMAALTTHGNR